MSSHSPSDFFEHSRTTTILIVEQTFFCAIDPTFTPQVRRKNERALLSKNGKLSGLLFDTQFQNGPPFGGTMQEYQDLFSFHFNIKTLASCYNSIPQRMGNECFIIATKKQAAL